MSRCDEIGAIGASEPTLGEPGQKASPSDVTPQTRRRTNGAQFEARRREETTPLSHDEVRPGELTRLLLYGHSFNR